jgi:predicted nucleotidyltransferase
MHGIQTRAELLIALQSHASAIQAFGVSRLGVFGSFARDAATLQSDVDLFVEFEAGRKTLKNLVGLSRYLENQLGRKVDLVTPASLNAFIGKHILKEVHYVALAA